MRYKIKEIFYSIQGEGFHSGRSAVFCRFSGCNLWSGKEEDKETALCPLCDTDITGTDGINGKVYSNSVELTSKIDDIWENHTENKTDKFLICTGGEPMLQLDKYLIENLHNSKFQIAVETNGTIPVTGNIDWICVSPKAGTELKQISGDELKLIYPQRGITPEDFNSLNFNHFFLQPKYDSNIDSNTKLCLDYCLTHPQWQLSIQLHKILNIK